MSARSSGSPSLHAARGAAAWLLATALLLVPASAWAQNPIVTENALAGSPASVWDIGGAGDPSIQGFATDISVDRGETVRFKIATDAAAYTIDIYRLGYYQGDGARLVGSGIVTATLPQSQPAPLTEAATGLVDCGNWAESAHWDVPAGAVSGIYIAKLTRDDTQGASHIAFVVRDDASTSALLFKTSDATWQAYNVYGGNSLYVGTVAGYPSGHATKVSYNRPFLTRAGGGGGGAEEDWLFNAEYPMVRWLEANGYDVTYTTDVDADRRGNLIAQHDVLLSVGHDEYWSAGERAAVTAARDAGTHLAFFSGNEVYWKTRWEPSTDGSATAFRTLVCYKEGTLGENACGGKCDPLSDTWTGLWRDGCAFPAADGCSPENALSGQISWGLGEAGLQVPDSFSAHRFWRNTSVATLGAGQTATLGARILGYEFDYEQYPASNPAGRVTLSGTTVGGNLHRLSLYRAPSGALVFGAGTVQWSWGLDDTHDRGNDAPVTAIRQATVNLLADMGVQPGSLQPGLTAAVASGDAVAPTSTLVAPLDGATVTAGLPVAVTGTAVEAGGGVIGAVEVSTDGGVTWAAATGGASWSYTWTPAVAGVANLRVRAADDLGNLETPGAGITVTVNEPGPAACPCNVFIASETPTNPNNNDGQPIELGMKFRATEDGLVTGARYYKGTSWTTGTRLGHLWSAAGAQLAEVTFTGESGSGWQEALFTTPVAITAGATYVISVYSPSGHYGFTGAYFGAAVVRPPLGALADGEDGPNGVYFYGGTGFPTSTFNASNYWVDVVFETGPDETPPTVTATSPGAGASGVSPFAAVTATFSEPLDPSTVTGATFELRDAGSALVPATVSWEAGTRTATLTPGVTLTHLATYTATLKGGLTDPRLKDPAGNALAADVTWSFTIAPPDLTPPTVASTLPASGASGVLTTTTVEVVFDEPMSPATINTSTLELRDALAVLVPATVSYNVYLDAATLTPSAPLAAATVHTLTVKGGGADPRVKDLSGNALSFDHTMTFTTAAGPPPPPDEGPGGPVLVISRAADPFGRYYAEILRCEGLNAFRVRDLSLVTAATLDSHAVVILAPGALSAAEVSMFETWVAAGGGLIAVRPDAQLASLLGLAVAGGTLANGYLAVNTAAPPGQGIVGETMQFHDTADLWTPAGATAVATLYSDATTATVHPAVTLRAAGGGWAAAFTYDLARSIVYTRQGNPAWAGDERDGTAPVRSNDMFYGAKAGDPQPDWVDLDKVAIPQADEQQRLLANLIQHTARGGLPLPRFWYFPAGKKAVIIHTGDNHGTGGTPVRFDANLAQSPGGCSLPDWECVRSTSYLYAGGPLTDAQVALYQSQGFEIGIHLNTGCADWTPASLDAAWTSQLAAAQSLYPSLSPQTTHRTHCIAWSDWSSEAEIQAARGVRLDVNYYYWPPGWVQDRPGLFTGSAMPMRYAKLDGTLVDCFQAATQMTDESGQSYPMTPDSLLERALDVRGYYGAFCTNIHLDGSSETINAQVVASAQSRGVPVVSAAQMLTWIDGRTGSTFDDVVWDGSQLTFAIAVAAGAGNLRAMLPLWRGAASLQTLTRDASPVAFTTETIKGVAYAFFPAAAGSYAAGYAEDTTPPAISAVTATPDEDGTALVTWTTDEPADSRVDYGTDAGALTLQVASATLVTSHALTLTGLAANTTYHFRVTAVDGAGNPATSPAPPALPATFTTPAGPCAADRTAADFALGTAVTTAITTLADGEVSLIPAAATEFPGAALPAGWSSANGAPWTGGTPVVAGGSLTVNGCIAGTDATFADGASVEFTATFQAEAFQHVGLVGDLAFNSPWVIVSTGTTGAAIVARSNDNSAGVALAGASFGAPHRYRIDRMGSQFRFWVDGVLRDSLTQTGTAGMIVAASDLNSNATAVTVDWVRVSPYGTPGEYVSRVHDAGQTVNWGAATWVAGVPVGASLAISVRTGDTPSPDGSWSPYAPLAASGAGVAAYARYLQYRAELTSAAGRVSAELEEIEFACTTGPDSTPPGISVVSATPAPGGTTATVTWTTSEPATSVVDYGTSPGSLTSQESDGTLVSSHSVLLTGLTPATVYHFRVTSADAATNSATSPAPPADPATFTTPAPPVVPCLADSLRADFAAGSHGGTYVAATGNGEVILAPTEASEFTGATLPAGWASESYGGGGASATLTGTAIQLDGSFVRTDALTYMPGRTVEFVATFDATASGQHAGFGNTLNETTWAIFSTGPSGGTLIARTNQAGSALEQDLGGSSLGAPHRFRVDWGVSSVTFSIDGAVVATIANAVSGPLRPIASDGPVGGNPLLVDWMRMTPYAASGTFESRVLDAGAIADWGGATWDAATPAGTGLVMSVRTGPTPSPDGLWTGFSALAAPGADVPGSSRYLQYRAELATADPVATPELRSFGVACEVAPDGTPPVISAVTATPGLTTATITWSTDEPATSVVEYGLSAGSLTGQVASGALVTSHSVELTGLAAGTLHHYRVTSADGVPNAASDPAPPGTRTFTTAAPACLTDAVAADFAAGSVSGTYLSETTDGEVILAPALGNEFSGVALPGDWISVPWTGGTTTVTGGEALVDGARLTPLSTSGYGIGRVLEFVATFGAANYQNAGLGAGDNSLGATGMFATGAEPWAMFGTAATTTTLYTRLNPGGDVSLGGGYLGAPHHYRIEWWSSAGGDSVAFYVDGASVDRRATTIPTATPMRPGISDFDLGGPALAVSWVRLSPYGSPGTFLSRIYDSGGIATWERLTWTADLPAGAGLAMSVRMGNTPSPDGTWTGFAGVAASGDVVGGSSRYVQYQAVLTTSDPAATPALRDVSLACTVCAEATPPAPIADLSATGTGVAGGGRAHVRLDWSGVAEGHTVRVYRKAYGDYPLYRATHGGVPDPPATPAAAEAAGWDSTTVHTANGLDAPPTRGYWYHVAFVTNGCGVVSGPSNVTAGALDYILGDVSDGVGVCVAGGEAGNTIVNTADISALGDDYGQAFGPSDDRVCLDVGPTVDYGIRSRPAPDGLLDFEDLVVYALNYEIPLPAIAAARPARAEAAADRDELVVTSPWTVRAGERFDVVLRFRGTGAVRALSARLAWDATVAEIGGVAPAGMLESHGGVAFSPEPGAVDAAVLGSSSAGLTGEGELVTISFRALRDGAPAVRLDRALARDAANRAVTLGAGAPPAPPVRYATALGKVFPSPFHGALSVSFSLAAETPVRLVVFDLAGRVVRHLEDGARPAGLHVVTWDGRNDAGRAASAGLYILRFEAGGVRQTRRVQLIR
jgi:hypothetical protein